MIKKKKNIAKILFTTADFPMATNSLQVVQEKNPSPSFLHSSKLGLALLLDFLGLILHCLAPELVQHYRVTKPHIHSLGERQSCSDF